MKKVIDLTRHGYSQQWVSSRFWSLKEQKNYSIRIQKTSRVAIWLKVVMISCSSFIICLLCSLQFALFASLSENFLWCIMYVEEAVFTPIFRINFCQCFAQRYQRTIIHQEEQCLGWSNFHAITNDWYKLRHCKFLWHQKFTLLQLW